MGTGKPLGPEQKRGYQKVEEPQYSPAEVVSQLLYAGKTLQEIAGYDPYQLVWVVSRKRDKDGRLVRKSDELPPWVKVDERGMRIPSSNAMNFATMFEKVKEWQGLDKKQTQESWDKYLEDNPRLRIINA